MRTWKDLNAAERVLLPLLVQLVLDGKTNDEILGLHPGSEELIKDCREASLTVNYRNLVLEHTFDQIKMANDVPIDEEKFKKRITTLEKGKW